MRDFIDILTKEGYYMPDIHDKSNHTIRVFGNLVEFFSVDQYQKVKGRKRDILWANEANELTLDEWRQLSLRTTWKKIIDFNPEDEFHWIYDVVMPREDCETFITTYKDNPFLEDEVVKEIELLKKQDPDYWRVFGLGQRGRGRASVFVHYNEASSYPEEYKLVRYGLDFGFSADPCACVAIYSNGHGFYYEQVFHRTEMYAADIVRELKSQPEATIVADSEDPRLIAELRRAGLPVVPAKKNAGSVREGIRMMQSRPMILNSDSQDLLREFKGYKYTTDHLGRATKQPEKGNDHSVDAARYAVTHYLKAPRYGSVRVR